MTQQIRVLQIFGSLNVGGAESRMMDVYRHIDRDKVQFDFLSMQTDKQYFEEEISSLGGKVIKVAPPRESGILGNFKSIIDAIKLNGPYDVVHAHTSHHCGVIMLAAKLEGVPIRISHARTTSSKHLGLKTKIMLLFGRLLIQLFATKRLAISKDAALYLYGKRCMNKGEATIIPNAIDTSKYFIKKSEGSSELRGKYFLENKSPIIGHVGRFDSMKNHPFLIDIMSEFVKKSPNSLLIFIGDGPKRKEIEEKVKRRNLQSNVFFLGIRSDVNVWMKIFDIVVMPSLFEGLCGVAIEAQAAGTPSVLSNGIPREVDMGTGLIKFVSLEESLKTWVDTINEQLQVKVPNLTFIEHCFNERGYTLNSEIEKLSLIYKGR